MTMTQMLKDSVRTPYPKEEDALIVGKDNTKEINIYNEDIVIIRELEIQSASRGVYATMRL